MIVFIAAGALVVIGLAAALAMGRLSQMSVQAPDAVTSIGGHPLPDGEFSAADVDHLRFDIAFRGYRMSEVDAAIGALQRRILELEDARHETSPHGAAVPGGHGGFTGGGHAEPRVPSGQAMVADDAPAAAPIPLRPRLHGVGQTDPTLQGDGPAS